MKGSLEKFTDTPLQKKQNEIGTVFKMARLSLQGGSPQDQVLFSQLETIEGITEEL